MHFTFKNFIALTCIWSPAKTILVFLLANARGIIVSHSIACAASSNRMCVKNPVKQRYQQINETWNMIKYTVITMQDIVLEVLYFDSNQN